MRKEVIGNAVLYLGDVLATLRTLPDQSAHCCVTSPPYWGLRDYGVAGQIGLEASPAEYVEKMVQVFREVRRVLRDDGTCWVNLGDSYVANRGNSAEKPGYDNKAAGSGADLAIRKHKITGPGLKEKDLVGIPWAVAFALRCDGWWLRQDIIWNKPNPMPESVTDRCTKSHEYIFMLSKSARYFYDQDAIKEPAIYAGLTGQDYGGYKDAANYEGKHADKQRGHSRRHAGFNDRWDKMEKAEQCSGMRNKRSVWSVATKPYPEAHFATFPPALIEPCILAGCPIGGTVLDPFNGSGTTGIAALEHSRHYIGIELNPDYVALTMPRLEDAQRQERLFA